MPADESKLVRAARGIEPHLFEVANLAGGFTVAVAQSVEGHVWFFRDLAWTPVLYLSGLILLVLAYRVNRAERGRRRAAEKGHRIALAHLAEAERSEKDAASALENASSVVLVSFYRRLGLGPAERISLYAYDGKGGFLQLKRYAEHRPFNEPGRDYYPEGEGFLGEAWRVGQIYKSDCPDRAASPAGYRRFHQEQGLSRAAVKDLTMPSRAYLGHALYGPSNLERVGVVMIESVRARGLVSAHAQEADHDLAALGALVVLSRPSANELSNASRVGL